MAMPPTPAAAPPAAADAMPPGAPADTDAELDAGNADEATEEECIATICKRPDGAYVLYAGDEPEAGEADAGMAPGAPAGAAGGEAPAPEGKTFDTPQALMRGVMELLNADGGAEDAFGAGFKGDKGSAPAPGM